LKPRVWLILAILCSIILGILWVAVVTTKITIPGGKTPQTAESCPVFDPKASQPLKAVTLPPKKLCEFKVVNGFQLPDPDCTPGSVNPTLTAEVLSDPHFKTSCARGMSMSEGKKEQVYAWYGLTKPANNRGVNEKCELDHLISLELGGSDGLENIWPQCHQATRGRGVAEFRQKDKVESYLGRQIEKNAISLSEAQRGIAKDWTRYLASVAK
jgi:hypothetical protein